MHKPHQNNPHEPSPHCQNTEVALVHALSGQPQCPVIHKGQSHAHDNDHSAVTLPPIPETLSHEEWNLRRGQLDAQALWKRCHNAKTHAKLRPQNPDACEIFDAMERTRALSWRGHTMKGLQHNITQHLGKELAANPHVINAETKSKTLLPHVVSMILRERITGEAPPESIQKTCNEWLQDIEDAIGDDLNTLAQLSDNQKLFASKAHETISHLWQALARQLPPNDQDDNSENTQDNQNHENPENNSEDDASQNDDNSELNNPMSQGQEENSSSENSEWSDSSSSSEHDELNMSDNDDFDPSFQEHTHLHQELWKQYSVYSREYDQTVSVEHIASHDELVALRQDLDNFTENLTPIIVRTANRLQRYLLAQQDKSWAFDLDDGWLDTSRLARVIVNPGTPASYKQEKLSEFRDSVITILIDNSGSMRGRPITVAAVTADILTRTLERCGVKVEVLGFTTNMWKGGKPREQWISDGKPKNPGRLNSLLHIVYKNADIAYRSSRLAFSAMLKEGLLKENIDGEALIWAYSQLMKRPEKRRILITISDGAPVDDATLSSNHGQYLDNHLRDVIAFIEKSSHVELLAIGIGHDVTRYYKNATTINDVQHLGEVMTSQLMELFKPSSRKKP